MEAEGRKASIDEISQEILKKEDVRAQTQYPYKGNHLDRLYRHNKEFNSSRKIFVGGLPADLTVEEFKAYFQRFGCIEDVVVMSDKETSRPRGFGFVTFGSPETANKVLKNQFYELKNKRVEVKKAVSKERMKWDLGNYYNAVYAGNTLGLPFGGYYYGITQDGFRAYNGLGYEGVSYVYYPHHSLDLNYYANNCPYQSWYHNADTYPHQIPCYYGNTPNGHRSKHSHKYRNRTPVVVKTNSNLKDFKAVSKSPGLFQKHLGSDDVDKEKGDTECDHSRSMNSNDDESGCGDHADTSEGLSLHSNGGCAKFIEALSS